jgi:hypothetical protein
MPSYNKSPFAAQPQKLIPGQPAYVFGSWNSDIPPTKGVVNNVALTTNVATVTVLINEGNIPAVGSLITIQGTASTSGLFNVTNATITAVSITASTGAGTITFALTHANVVSAADGGTFIIPTPEVGETLANGASLAVGVPYATPFTTESTTQSVTALVSFPSLPTTATVVLQGAIQNIDSEYQTIATVGTVIGGAASVTSAGFIGKWNFYRLLASSVTGGTSPTIVGKILI